MGKPLLSEYNGTLYPSRKVARSVIYLDCIGADIEQVEDGIFWSKKYNRYIAFEDGLRARGIAAEGKHVVEIIFYNLGVRWSTDNNGNIFGAQECYVKYNTDGSKLCWCLMFDGARFPEKTIFDAFYNSRDYKF